MGLPAKSRKGKKAWRKNIDDAQVVEVVEQETHQERRGPAVQTLPDTQLFFVDKGSGAAADDQAATARRLRAKREPRLTRAQLILQAPQAIKPVVSHKSPKRKVLGPHSARQTQNVASGSQALVPAAPSIPAAPQDPAQAMDLWDGDAAPEQGPGELPEPKALKPVGPTSRAAVNGKRPLPAPRIKAVEVDMAGCSYNPEPEAHQDALAAVVAAENKKLLRKELARPGLPLLDVDLAVACRQQDELAMLQTDADVDDNEIPLDEGGGGGSAPAEQEEGSKKAAQVKKTKKDRNREARAAAEARTIEERRALKRQRQELEKLPQLVATVEQEEQVHELRRARRKVVEEEKAASQPPKLSKLRFEDLNVQVLTSDEVGQGLRRLKAFPMLATERFKSLQKRGLVEVRRPAGSKATRRAVTYEKGVRREKALEGQDRLNSLKTTNRRKARALKAR